MSFRLIRSTSGRWTLALTIAITLIFVALIAWALRSENPPSKTTLEAAAFPSSTTTSPEAALKGDAWEAHIYASATRASRARPRPTIPRVHGSGSKTTTSGSATASARDSRSSENRALGQAMAAERGWTGEQWECLDSLWGAHESSWRTDADNPRSSAYGIPQATPGSKMATVGADWRTNPRTQITWGLNYIAGRYGTPCKALSARRSKGWY